jgi:hypothetical protein
MSKNQPFKGNVRIAANSSLRKLMRAARRGTIPPERMVVIRMAMHNADQHRDDYLTGYARRNQAQSRF